MTDGMTRGSSDKNVSAMISEDCVLSDFERRSVRVVPLRGSRLHVEDRELWHWPALICRNSGKFWHPRVILTFCSICSCGPISLSLFTRISSLSEIAETIATEIYLVPLFWNLISVVPIWNCWSVWWKLRNFNESRNENIECFKILNCSLEDKIWNLSSFDREIIK